MKGALLFLWWHKLYLYGCMAGSGAQNGWGSGRCSEGERDAIEEQVAVSIKACTQNVARLKDSAAAGSKSAATHPDQQQLATHRLGVV